MKLILAIDQGTTGSRVIAYDEQGRIQAGAYREFPQYFPSPGWVEHDPEEIWQSVRQSLHAVLQRVPIRSVVGLGISNQRETTVLWDAQTDRPVHRAIVWQCRRTAARCHALKRRPGLERQIREKTGLPVDAYFSATKIEWLLRRVPEARRLARQGRLRFGTTDSWVLWKLTGGQAHATDYTNASRTLLLNLEKRVWDPELLRLFQVPQTCLPRVLPSSGIFGHTIRLGTLPSGLPVAGAAGDQQAALFGQACFEPGTVKNTYGTGCFMLMNTGQKRVQSTQGLLTTLACDGRGKPCYALEGSIFIAGAAIQWLRDGLKILDAAPKSEEMARDVKDNGGVYFVPALVGLGAPYWDSEARGTIVGLTRGTRREHLVRAALEAMAYSTRDVLAAMEKDAAMKIRQLKIDGGAANNNFLCQFQADQLGRNVIRPKIRELTSLGAAFLAGLALGIWRDAGHLRRVWKSEKTFRPHVAPARAASLYRGWRDAVARTLTGRSA